MRGDRLLALSSVLVHEKRIPCGGQLTHGLGGDLDHPFGIWR